MWTDDELRASSVRKMLCFWLPYSALRVHQPSRVSTKSCIFRARCGIRQNGDDFPTKTWILRSSRL